MADADATELQGDGEALGEMHTEEEEEAEAEKASNWGRWRLAGIFSE